MRATLTLATVIASALLFAFSLGLAPAPAADTASIYATIAGMNDHTILYVGIRESEEAATLNGKEEYTLLAPTDAAFKKLDDATIKQLATDKAAVKKLIRAHLLPGKKTTEDLKALTGQEIRTLQGSTLRVEEFKDGLRIGGARLVTANFHCSNGVIHVIDTVLPAAKE